MNSDNITIWNCPRARCSGKLVRRYNKQGDYFLGCTKFPDCHYTQKDELQEEDGRYPEGLPDAASVWE